MKKLIIILFLFLSVILVHSQSRNVEDYTKIFTVGSKPYYVDVTSVEKLNNGNRVFWSLQTEGNTVLLGSWEVNCRFRKIRIRSFLELGNLNYYGSNRVRPWERPTTSVMRGYLTFGCN